MNSTDGSAASAGSPAPGAKKYADLWLRVATGVVLAPLVIWIIWLGGHAYMLMLFLALAIGAREWIKLTAPKPAPLRLTLLSLLGLFAMLVCLELAHPDWDIAVILLLIPLMWAVARWVNCEKPLITAVGTSYLGISLLCLWVLRGTPDDLIGRGLVFYLFFSVWAVDIGAYFAGRTFGGPKLAPKLSPKKTWSGLVGGGIAAAVVGYLWARFAGAQMPEIALLIGLPLAIIAQAGDIMESALKRRFDAKDSGSIMPGHGGMLDRIDGLLLATPAFTIFQLTAGKLIGWW
jgi:phosphatidate cytidylyltransferase